MARVGRGRPGAAALRAGTGGDGGRRGRRHSRPTSRRRPWCWRSSRRRRPTLPAYARFAGGAVFLSIMAGRSDRAACARPLGAEAAIVRAMPNTPAAVRHGITVACAGPGRDRGAARRCATGCSAPSARSPGSTDEALLDPVTAVSGSGPAYVFLLAELLEQAAVEQGIPPDLARLLARATVAGSGALLAASDRGRGGAAPHGRPAPAAPPSAALEVLMAPDAWPATLAPCRGRRDAPLTRTRGLTTRSPARPIWRAMDDDAFDRKPCRGGVHAHRRAGLAPDERRRGGATGRPAARSGPRPVPGARRGAAALRRAGRPGRAGAGARRRDRIATGCSTC